MTAPLIAARTEAVIVAGVPRPQGSLTPYVIWRNFSKGQATCPVCRQKRFVQTTLVDGRRKESQASFRAWRKAVTAAAAEVLDGRAPMTGPLALRLTFTVPRPEGHCSKGKSTAGRLLPSAPLFPFVRPDGPKYQRAVEDALTDARLWDDDGQVVEWHGAKVYPSGTAHAGSESLRLARPDGTDMLIADVLAAPGAVIRVWQV